MDNFQLLPNANTLKDGLYAPSGHLGSTLVVNTKDDVNATYGGHLLTKMAAIGDSGQCGQYCQGLILHVIAGV